MAITKQQLALRYMPDITPGAAVRQLMRWIKMNPELSEALSKTGFYKTQKVLTSKQYQLIIEFLGEP